MSLPSSLSSPAGTGPAAAKAVIAKRRMRVFIALIGLIAFWKIGDLKIAVAKQLTMNCCPPMALFL